MTSSSVNRTFPCPVMYIKGYSHRSSLWSETTRSRDSTCSVVRWRMAASRLGRLDGLLYQSPPPSYCSRPIVSVGAAPAPTPSDNSPTRTSPSILTERLPGGRSRFSALIVPEPGSEPRHVCWHLPPAASGLVRSLLERVPRCRAWLQVRRQREPG